MGFRYVVASFVGVLMMLSSASVFAECSLRPDDITDIEDAVEKFDAAWERVNEANIGYYSNYADANGRAKWQKVLDEAKPILSDSRSKLAREIAIAKKYCG